MKPMELMNAPNGETKKICIINTEITLQSSEDGVEVIHFKLGKGDIFSNSPDWATNPDFLRSITSLKGSLEIHIGHEKVTINGGSTTTSIPSSSPIRFKAITNCEFLIVTSEPIFEEIYVNKGMKIHQLAADIEEKDGYTLNHCSRIQRLSDLVGDKLGLSSDELITLTYGAFLHDIGKVKIPLKILQKPGKLTSAEWKVMKKHPLYGAEILRETGFAYLTEASSIVEQHHEKWDGKGYPYGLRGEEISLGASIVSVVDAYDAMVSDRIYCPSLSKEEALEEIVRNRGTMYRPEVVDAFVAVYDQLETISPLTKYKKIN
ncbi:HD-GYP domain-containing protein [Bacillus sp. CECT 9360]|uniref:HD-GYP domain-containing protein n=1 Tax=Bacillus sp. CECT 9360 TaxID=2845821 RepID=UPI001E4A8A1A|nr:HD-GYP domain-containing protein [Bacillus sp. CECT 9360]